MPGKSARAREAAQSHTGALAGDHATATALLLREAVVVVDSLDELFDTTAILARFPQPPAGGTAFVTGSGAMKNIALDFADDIGLDLPALSAATTSRLTAMLPAYAVAENPLDYTTIGVRNPGLIGEIIDTMLADDHVGNLVLCIPVGPPVAQRDKAEHLLPALARATKPAVLVLIGDSGPIEPFFVRRDPRERRAVLPLARPRPARAGTGGRLRRSAAARRAGHARHCRRRCRCRPRCRHRACLAEYQGKAWLAAAGLAVPAGGLARAVDEAVAHCRPTSATRWCSRRRRANCRTRATSAA